MQKDQHHLTDQELLDKYQNDQDLNWVGILLQRYTLLLFGVGMKYLSNEEEARDMVQQVFLKVLTEIHKYKVHYFKSWLYMIAKNQCLMQLRAKGFRTVELSENDLSGSADEFDLTELKEKDFLLMDLQDAITELPEEQRICINAFFMEKKSYQTIANETGMSLMKVKSSIQNGKRNIKISIGKKILKNPNR